MDPGTLSGLVTGALIVLFVGIWVSAWSARRRGTFDAAARMPLEEEEPSPRSARRGNGAHREGGQAQ